MTVTENLLILGIFPIFTIGMQALPTVVQYELPPPVPLPSYTHSQIFLSQYLDVPMLSVEEMERAFPWLKFTKPTDIQAQEQTSQNEQRYTVYYSPAKVILNKNINLYSNINFLNDEAKGQFQQKGNLYVPSKPDTLNIDATDNLSQIRFQEEGKLHSNHRHKDFAPNFLQSSFTEQHDVAGIDEISPNGKSTVGQLNVTHNKSSSHPNVEREYDNLENKRNIIRLNGCYDNGKKHCKQMRDRQISKDKLICGKKCEERNNDDDKSQKNYSTNDESLSDRTKESNEQLIKLRDDCMEELVKRNPDGLDNCETHNAESKRRPVYLYPKVPSAYLEPPKLAVDNYQFYRKQKRKLSNRKRPKQNAVKNRLQNHRLDSKEKNAVDLEEKLKDHKTEYIRDHAPEHQEEETTTPKEADIDEHNKKKKSSNSFELSPNGERVEFQIHGYDGPKTYIFGFDTGAGKNRHFRLEERLKDGTVKGHYGYYDATGKLRMVQYTAKPLDGYQEKHHESSNHKPEG